MYTNHDEYLKAQRKWEEEQADAYFKSKVKSFAEILKWANKPIAFVPRESEYAMHFSETLGCGLSYDGKTVVHVNEVALYEQCESPYRDNPDFWIAHGEAGNPFVEIDPHGPEEV
jgi:hypothetical protein